jgi:hypothetical protein
MAGNGKADDEGDASLHRLVQQHTAAHTEIGDMPPAEHEANYYRKQEAATQAA